MRTTTDYLAARRHDYRTSHTFHLLLTVLTLGAWLPLWALVGTVNALHRWRIDRQLKRR